METIYEMAIRLNYNSTFDIFERERTDLASKVFTLADYIKYKDLTKAQLVTKVLHEFNLLDPDSDVVDVEEYLAYLESLE